MTSEWQPVSTCVPSSERSASGIVTPSFSAVDPYGSPLDMASATNMHWADSAQLPSRIALLASLALLHLQNGSKA